MCHFGGFARSIRRLEAPLDSRGERHSLSNAGAGRSKRFKVDPGKVAHGGHEHRQVNQRLVLRPPLLEKMHRRVHCENPEKQHARHGAGNRSGGDRQGGQCQRWSDSLERRHWRNRTPQQIHEPAGTVRLEGPQGQPRCLSQVRIPLETFDHPPSLVEPLFNQQGVVQHGEKNLGAKPRNTVVQPEEHTVHVQIVPRLLVKPIGTVRRTVIGDLEGLARQR